jgi:hypothetical protein
MLFRLQLGAASSASQSIQYRTEYGDSLSQREADCERQLEISRLKLDDRISAVKSVQQQDFDAAVRDAPIERRIGGKGLLFAFSLD